MSSGVSVLIQTRGRPKRFAECVSAIEKYKQGDVEVLSYVDEDDKSDYPNPTIRGPRVGASKRLLALVEKAQYDHFLFIGDDQVVMSPSWDVKMRALMPADRIGLVYSKDNWKESVSAILVHRRWWQLTHLFPNDFSHFGLDTYMTDIARTMGRLFMEKSVVIEHRHFRNGKAERDETYDYPRHSMFNQSDQTKLTAYRKSRMPTDIKILKEEIERFSRTSQGG